MIWRSHPIDGNGLVTGEDVFADSAAVVQGFYAGKTGLLSISIFDSISDNFGTYAGDGIDDDWQARYFGLNNPEAAPLLDPDHDGFNNHFEFVAGLVPSDAGSHFQIKIHGVQGQPDQLEITFSPILPGRTYIVRTSTSLESGSLNNLIDGIQVDNGTERRITDPNTLGLRKFYRIEVSKP